MDSKDSPHRDFEWAFWNHQCHSELLTIRGHRERIRSVKYSLDGKRIVTASRDGFAKIWNSSTGALLHSLNVHSQLRCAAFSPDGENIVTAGKDRIARLWDSRTGKLRLALRGHSDEILGVSFSPDSKTLITTSWDRTARIWDVFTGAEKKSLQPSTVGPPASVTRNTVVSCAVFSPDGRRVITGVSDGRAIIWDASTGRSLQTLDQKTAGVESVDVSADGGRVLTSGWDDQVKLWDLATGKVTVEFKGHFARFSPDGRRVVTTEFGKISFWDADSGEKQFSILAHAVGVRSVDFSPRGDYVVTAGDDNVARVWDASESRQLSRAINSSHQDKPKPRHTEDGMGLALSKDGRRVVFGLNSDAKVFDIEGPRELVNLVQHSQSVYACDFSPDGRSIVTGSLDNTVKLWDLETGHVIRTIRGYKEQIMSVEFSPDGKQIAVASADGWAGVWETNTGKRLVAFHGPNDPDRRVGDYYGLQCARFSHDGKELLTGTRLQAEIWDIRSKRIVKTLTVPNFVNDGDFSADGSRIITACGDGTALIFDLRSGKVMLTLEGHVGTLFTARFSPSGRRIVTAGTDQTVRVWDAFTGRELLVLTSPYDKLPIARFSADGRRLVAGGFGEVRVWDADFDTSWINPSVARGRRASE